ncbi:MAG: AmmeMemoRadiSam system protein A [Spirochaetes bacterium]|nr:AmmeMemoRadiSam system protein A [Spirochaetota bacterium]
MSDTFSLSNDEKRYLIRIARGAVWAKLTGNAPSPPQPPSETVFQPAGAFVTLRVPQSGREKPAGDGGGALRGCIGHVIARQPLEQTIRDAAVSAAFRDPRFDPITLPELERVRFEISVLSPLRRVSSPQEVIPGTHGVMVSASGHSGLLLPQVATEQGWERETFLTHCCYKAHLAPECWREPSTEIQVFTATVFDEK